MCNTKIFSFFHLFFFCMSMVHQLQNFPNRKEEFEFHCLNFVTSLALTDESNFLRVLEKYRTKDWHRNNSSCSSRGVLEHFFHKKKQCFLFTPSALRYHVGALREYKYVYEVNSHTKVLKCWGVLIFFLKENLCSFTCLATSFPLFELLPVLKEAIVSVHSATISGKNVVISQILCFIMHFYENLLFNH